MFDNKERISVEEAESMIKDLVAGYIADGYDENDAQVMAIQCLRLDFEW